MKAVGKEAAAKGIALYMVPGMNHCQGGAGTDTFDKMAAIEAWVATGARPKQIIASHQTAGRWTRRARCAVPAGGEIQRRRRYERRREFYVRRAVRGDVGRRQRPTCQ